MLRMEGFVLCPEGATEMNLLKKLAATAGVTLTCPRWSNDQRELSSLDFVILASKLSRATGVGIRPVDVMRNQGPVALAYQITLVNATTSRLFDVRRILFGLEVVIMLGWRFCFWHDRSITMNPSPLNIIPHS